MGRGGTIQGTFGWDNTPFVQGMREAERIGNRTTVSLQSKFEGLFKRSPGRRAEKALSGLIGDITGGGGLAQGVARFAGRISGLGLGIGIAVGAGVEVFEKLKESVDEVSEAREKLDQHMRRPLNIVSNLSSGELKQEIQSLGAAIDDLRKKENTFAHGFTNIFKDIAHQQGFRGLTDLGKSSMQDQMEIQEAISRKQAEERAAGRNELIRGNVLRGIGNDPKRAALAEARMKLGQEIAALQSGPQDKGVKDKIREKEAEYDQINKNYKLSQAASDQEFEDAKNLLLLKRQAATPEEEKKITATLKLKQTMRQLERTDLSPEETKALTLQKLSQENELLALNPKTKAGKNPFAWGTIASREWEENVGAEGKGGFGSIARRAAETNDPTAWGSLAHSAAQRGEIPSQGNEDQNAAVVAELKEMKVLMSKFIGD